MAWPTAGLSPSQHGPRSAGANGQADLVSVMARPLSKEGTIQPAPPGYVSRCLVSSSARKGEKLTVRRAAGVLGGSPTRSWRRERSSRSVRSAASSPGGGRCRRRSTFYRTCMQKCMLISMQSTSVRIDQATHRELKRLADRLGTTVGETVALAVRRLRQDRIGEELTAALSPDEVDWLDADLG